MRCRQEPRTAIPPPDEICGLVGFLSGHSLDDFCGRWRLRSIGSAGFSAYVNRHRSDDHVLCRIVAANLIGVLISCFPR